MVHAEQNGTIEVKEVKERQLGAVGGAVLATVGVLAIGAVSVISMKSSGVTSFSLELSTDKVTAGMIAGAVIAYIGVVAFVSKKR